MFRFKIIVSPLVQITFSQQEKPNTFQSSANWDGMAGQHNSLMATLSQKKRMIEKDLSRHLPGLLKLKQLFLKKSMSIKSLLYTGKLLLIILICLKHTALTVKAGATQLMACLHLE
ncbi:hypothetical protein BVG97_24140 [Serratia marcescens]|nr:hypothetical protein BVG97_24140 [Serratia marcescens]